MPNKKVLVSLLVAIVIVVAGVWLARSPGTSNISNELSISDSFYSEGNEDSDGDGLKDWEEVLWDTDKNNRDTDGDGVIDGDEIRNNTNPKIPGPRDEITDEQVERIQANFALQDILSINQTDSVFNQALPAILVKADENIQGNVSAESIYYDLDSLVASVTLELTNVIPEYSISDIKVSNSNTITIVNYVSDILRIALENSSDDLKPELEIVGLAFGNNDPAPLLELDKNIEAYRGTKNDLLDLVVPASASDIHLEMINNYTSIIIALEEMKKILDDPLAGVVGVERYRTYTQRNDELFVGIGVIMQDL